MTKTHTKRVLAALTASLLSLSLLAACGGQDSAARRKALLKRLELPEHMTAPCLLDYLNVMMTRDEFMALELDEK